jgi:CRP/FNR family transcriptional regulator, cyclic AMP receptor protein
LNAVSELDLRSFLGSIPPLSDCFRDLVDAAGSRIRCNVYERGERVYAETDESRNVYALHHGRVRTLRITPQGKDVTLYLVEPGQLFGVDSIANGGVRQHLWGYDAEAMHNDTVVVSLPREEFSQVAAQRPELMGHVIRSLWTQSQDLMDQAETRAFHDVRGRLAHALLMLGYKEGIPDDRGLLIRPALTHEELAALAGTRRESVTMVLGAWKREGIVTTADGDRSIIILDVERLADYREGGTSARVAVESMLFRLSSIERRQQRESRVTEVEIAREHKRAAYQTYARR